jgi:uncharacterized membrane protein YagU involved in acid resistance
MDRVLDALSVFRAGIEVILHPKMVERKDVNPSKDNWNLLGGGVN